MQRKMRPSRSRVRLSYCRRVEGSKEARKRIAQLTLRPARAHACGLVAVDDLHTHRERTVQYDTERDWIESEGDDGLRIQQ